MPFIEDSKHRHAIAIDLPELLARCGGDRRFVEELLQCFADELPKLLAGVFDAAERQDERSLAQHTHALKGSAANLSMKSLTSWAERIEANLTSAESAASLRTQFEAVEQAAIQSIRTGIVLLRSAA